MQPLVGWGALSRAPGGRRVEGFQPPAPVAADSHHLPGRWLRADHASGHVSFARSGHTQTQRHVGSKRSPDGRPSQTQVIIPLSSWAPSPLAPSPAVKKKASRRPELTWFSPDAGWVCAVGLLPLGRADSVGTGSHVDRWSHHTLLSERPRARIAVRGAAPAPTATTTQPLQ